MAYSKTVWNNGATPAINATNLNKIERQLEQISGGYTNTSATDDYVFTMTNITSYVDLTGQLLTFKATVANTTTATLNINGLGAKSIVRGTSTALLTGDIIANQWVTVLYDGTNFQLVSQGGDVSQATKTETLSNKTLTAPKIANAGYIADANGNELIKFVTTTSAVNEFQVTNAATGNSVKLEATGTDTNIDINIAPKGVGIVEVNGSSAMYAGGVIQAYKNLGGGL